MNVISVIASVIVGISFVVAGGSKLAAGESWPTQARGLDAPAWTIPTLPWFELVLGALLIVQVQRQVLAVVAAVVLAAFTLLIVRKLRQGERPPCACFGAWSAKPIGRGHLLRNAALIVAAVVAAL